MSYQFKARIPGKFMTGVNAGYLQKAGYYTSKEFEAIIKRATDFNAEWITLNVSIVQERWFSQNIAFDYQRTAKDHELEYAVKLCHENMLKVMLKPIILCLDGSWRGMINFLSGDEHPQLIEGVMVDYWSKWFSSYRAAIKRYATIAQILNVDCFCVGSELLGTQKWKIKEWQKTIAHARQYFKNEITYELAIADSKEHVEMRENNYLDEYHQTEAWEWYRDLDFLSASRKFTSLQPVVMQEELQPLKALSKTLSKAILLSNCKVDTTDFNNSKIEGIIKSMSSLDFISGCFI
jgi:hypothetical protein